MARTELHPFIHPAEQYENRQYPIRDDTRLAPGEDLDRQPDGIPPIVIGMTIVVAALFALATFGMIVVTTWFGRFATIAVAGLALAMLVSMRQRIKRDRDRVHPSR
jgi:hypothetical protein